MPPIVYSNARRHVVSRAVEEPKHLPRQSAAVFWFPLLLQCFQSHCVNKPIPLPNGVEYALTFWPQQPRSRNVPPSARSIVEVRTAFSCSLDPQVAERRILLSGRFHGFMDNLSTEYRSHLWLYGRSYCLARSTARSMPQQRQRLDKHR